jgi:hypothetical protein
MAIIVLIVIVGIAISAPIAAAVLVAVASRREDSAWSLGGPPRGPAAAAARRVVGFRARGIDWPRPQSRVPARQPAPAARRVRSPLPTQTRRPAADSQ